MKKKTSAGRRNFLKITAVSAAGLALGKANKVFAAPATWTTGMAINPNIDNMRVVSCYDTQMFTVPPNTALPSTFEKIDALVSSLRVQANMDAMAMQLANKTTADDAWKTIFRIPTTKTWATTKVAIKVNVIEPRNMARIAVVGKFCKVLSNLGVLPANIIIYDGAGGNTTYGAGWTHYTTYFGLNDPTKIPAVVSNFNASMGGTIAAPVPNNGNQNCTAYVANGTIDILINIATNKGHTSMGGATLSMKNHFGTFTPNHVLGDAYIMNISQSDAIIGGTPPRQQLCFIDSILANKTSNTGAPDSIPCYLVMGVFGPAVDYLTVKKIREGVMGCKHTDSVIDSYVTTFGYATTDPVWVNVPPAIAGVIYDSGSSNQSAGSFEVVLSNGSYKRACARFSFPETAGPLQVRIINMDGRLVRELNVSSFSNNKTVLWDGKSNSGRMVSPGNYAVKVRAGNFEQSRKFIVS
jgi:hypothetical protein